jgi:uncharacterized protein YlxP (DUF503 family)
MNLGIILLKIKKYFKDMFLELSLIYFEKGIDPFKKPAIYGFAAILISYLIYLPSASKKDSLKSELRQLEVISRYYNNYIQAKNDLKKYISMLPALKDKDEFLGYVLNTLASKYKISFSRIDSQKNIDTKFGVIVVYRAVQFSTDYYTLGNFIKDIENYKPFIYISSINIKKSENQTVIGTLDVDLSIGTIFVTTRI